MSRCSFPAGRQMSFTLLAVLLAGLLLAACAPAAPAENSALPDAGPDEEDQHDDMRIPALAPVELADGQMLRVVATTNIIGDVVASVGADRIELTVLVERGQDPHSYEPVARDRAAIETAHVVFVNGLDLEEGLIGTIEDTARGPVVPVSAGIEPLEMDNEADDHDEDADQDDHGHDADPHFWMDPHNVIIWTQNIAAVLAALDPASAGVYEASAAAYIEALEELDRSIASQMAAIPADRRKLVTDHDAFGYFARRYGLEVIGTVVPGVSTTAEPSAGDIARLVEQIRTEGVPAIFVGTSAGARLEQLARMIASEAGQDIVILPLYTGSLDVPGTGADTYLGMMQFNASQIAAGLSH